VAQRRIGALVVEVARQVVEALEQAFEHRLVRRPARVTPDAPGRQLAKAVVRQVPARDADQGEVTGQRPLVGQVVDGRQQLAPGEIAGGAEHDERRRMDRLAVEAVGQRVLAEERRIRIRAGQARDLHPPAPPRIG
jgi:hypothetical protein